MGAGNLVPEHLPDSLICYNAGNHIAERVLLRLRVKETAEAPKEAEGRSDNPEDENERKADDPPKACKKRSHSILFLIGWFDRIALGLSRSAGRNTVLQRGWWQKEM